MTSPIKVGQVLVFDNSNSFFIIPDWHKLVVLDVPPSCGDGWIGQNRPIALLTISGCTVYFGVKYLQSVYRVANT